MKNEFSLVVNFRYLGDLEIRFIRLEKDYCSTKF